MSTMKDKDMSLIEHIRNHWDDTVRLEGNNADKRIGLLYE